MSEAAARTMHSIAAEVAARRQLSLKEMRSRSRERRLAWARHEAFALMRAEGRFSLTQIGRFFGGLRHRAVIYGARKHIERSA